MVQDNFPALPGIYRVLFLYLEPMSTMIAPVIMVWLFPGASWFYHQLIPSALPTPTASLEPRTLMLLQQLTNCYFLLGLLSFLAFRAVRDALPGNAVAQERILGASFLVLGFGDLTHLFATFFGLPADLQYTPSTWNTITYGNITFSIAFFTFRLAWYLGIGRTRYYFGLHPSTRKGLKTNQ